MKKKQKKKKNKKKKKKKNREGSNKFIRSFSLNDLIFKW